MRDLRASWSDAFGFDPLPLNYPGEHIDKKKCVSCHLEYFDQPVYGDADFYARISKDLWYYERNKWEYDVAGEIISRLTANNLLEIGCGNGHFLEKIAFLGLGAEGVDINNEAVESCRARGLKVDAVDIYDITKTYDLVVLFEVLEHMENAGSLFKFLTTKLLRPGGHLIIAVPNPEGYLKDVGINLLDMPPHHNTCWSRSTFEYLQVNFGLQIVEYRKEPIRYVHYLALLQSIVKDNAKLSIQTWKSKMLVRLQLLMVRLSAPLTYLRDRGQIDGQTHLVVFRNAG